MRMQRASSSSIRSLRGLAWAFALMVGATSLAHAKPYVDTKKRFSIELPAGWKLHPLPGDTSGMTFRRDEAGVFAILRVVVRPVAAGESAFDVLKSYCASFEDEIGYTPGTELPSTVGLIPSLHRSFTVLASGDKKTVRALDVHAVIAFGHVHILHFETLEREKKRFARDKDAIVGNYRVEAGRKLYAPLVGVWKNDAGGPDLILGETGSFVLGPLEGAYVVDGGRLTLVVDDGREQYGYQQKERALVLSSPNLEADLRYTRSGSAHFGRDKSADDQAPTRLLREELIGRWRALDVPSTDPLVLVLARSGAVQFGPLSGQWRYARGLLTIESTQGRAVTYTVSKDARGRRLTLGGGDLEREILLERE
jgi:hypothetical protein